MMTAAAVLTVVTGIASAQMLKADIPFAFRFGNNVYAAGSYYVSVNAPHNLIRLSNVETREGSMALAIRSGWPSSDMRSKADPTLTFQCGPGRCQLTDVWAGDGQPSLNLPRVSLGRDEVATMRIVHMSRANGD
jgi:hypothetical protein